MDNEGKTAVRVIGSIAIGVIVLGVGVWWFFKTMSIWSREMAGKAQLAEATFSKQIQIEEARSKNEAAIMNAEAKIKMAEADAASLKIKALAESEREIIRAEGAAKANEIIGASLKDNEAYLRYLWLQGIQDGNREVIYIPTEANLPILEAGKR